MRHVASSQSSGQVMLVVVVFFLLISITIVLGIATPILKQVSIANESLLSKKSYYTAESAVEDVYIRLQRNVTVAASETLTLNGGTAAITTTNSVAGKLVAVQGSVNSNIRKLSVDIARGTGVVFKYGTQAGQGGFIFENNSVLQGTLYSNGPIVGSNGSYITGDAYSAGLAGIIDNVDVGTNGTGNAHAYTVRNINATGNIYCQTGSANNKACNTSEAVPSAIDLPITNAQINSWKVDAETGGVLTGNQTVSGNTSLGPKKIIGNLTVSGTLTLTNTLYVTGNVILTGTVKLASSYGGSSGVIVADGYIDIGNSTIFQDSGTTGSYILLLTTSSCDASMSGSPCYGNYAIWVGNNSNISIANAQNGTVYFKNNSSVKESVAYTIHLKNNSTISYGSGLINPNFSSGPGGGYNITHFGEVQ